MSEINYYPEKNTCHPHKNNSYQSRRNQLSSSARKLNRQTQCGIHNKNLLNKNTAERKKTWREVQESLTPHSLPSLTLRTKPRSNRNPHNNRPHAFHVEAFVAFVAEKQLLRHLAGTALLAQQITIRLSLHHRVLGARHYVWHQPVLPHRRRVVMELVMELAGGVVELERRLRAVAEANVPLSRRRRGGWGHGGLRNLPNQKCRIGIYIFEETVFLSWRGRGEWLWELWQPKEGEMRKLKIK